MTITCIAATAIKKRIVRTASGNPLYRTTSGPSRIMRNGTNGDIEDEHTSLLAHLHQPEGSHLYKDERAWVRWPANVVYLTYKTLASSYVNVLLVFVPLGIIAGALEWSPTAVFLLNFFAIIPLAALLSFATEELSAKLGQTLGGLLNATFGNAVELIVRNISRDWQEGALLTPF